jgi:flagellar biosynthesis protein FlhF
LSEFITVQVAPATEINPGDRVVFLGTAGAGKSSVMGKMAAQLVVRKKKVKLVSLDDLKVGAADEIATYADLLQIEVTDVGHASSADSDYVLLIDTPAFPTSTDKIETLRRRIEAANPTICAVVVSALMRSPDVARFCSKLKALRPTHVIGTMLDLTSSHGSLFAATETTGRPLLYLSDAPGGMGMLTNPNAELMAEKMLALEGTHG